MQTSCPFSLGQCTEMLCCWVQAPLLFSLEIKIWGLCIFSGSWSARQAAESHPTLFLGECTGMMGDWVQPLLLSLLPEIEVSVVCTLSQSGRRGQVSKNLTLFLCSLLLPRKCSYMDCFCLWVMWDRIRSLGWCPTRLVISGTCCIVSFSWGEKSGSKWISQSAEPSWLGGEALSRVIWNCSSYPFRSSFYSFLCSSEM